MSTTPLASLEFHPVSGERWSDLESLLGDRGGWRGCWCMRWRLSRERFEAQRGDANRRALRHGIERGRISGVVGYRGDVPVAWCSLGPREAFPLLALSDLLAPVDARPVWSITCLYVGKGARRQGITVDLIKAAVAVATDNGADLVEGYPIVPQTPRVPVAAAMTGFYTAFQRAGFIEVLRRVEMRPIMRFQIEQ